MDHIIVVVEEARERLIGEYNIENEKISIIYNAKDAKYFESFNIDQELVNSFKDYFVITYVGGLNIHRGLDVSIRALPIIREKNYKR